MSKKLFDLLKGISYDKNQKFDENLLIDDISDNSTTVKENGLFICITGKNIDGHNFVQEAIVNGAKAIVCERDLPFNICQIKVKSTRKIVGIIASNFYDNPCKKLKIISVVGTNGKSTTASIIYSILKNDGKSVGFIGTSKIIIDEQNLPFTMTTPDPLYLHYIFNQMLKNDIKYVVMEVSAHAIYYHKMQGIVSEITVFTNFSQDHLDFFKTMEKYKQTKLSYMNSNYTKHLVLNIDDEVSREIINQTDLKYTTYGIKNPSEVFAINIKMNIHKSSFVLNLFDQIFNISFSLPAIFNIYNALSASTVCFLLGISGESIAKSLCEFEGVGGRFETIRDKKRNIIIDYAHTPKSLKSLLTTIKNLSKAKIVCVFGCPGNRDEQKRSMMGKIAGELCEKVVITCDNPHFENPIKIMKQIECGVKQTTASYCLIENRDSAIEYALQTSEENANIVICGKGEEQYQDINGILCKYNDKESIKKLLNKGK